MTKLVGLIPAAGKGVRARPYSDMIPKGMLKIGGRPNLERLICRMRDQLEIEDIYLTVGHLADVIKDYFKDGSWLGVRLHYVYNTELDRGLAWSVLLAGRDVAAPCCVMLSDECYIDSNHAEILDFPYSDGLVTCAITHTDDKKLVSQNYSVKNDGNTVLNLLEKPETVDNDILGLGTFILNPHFFPLLEAAFEQSPEDYVEFITFIDSLCRNKGDVLCFEMTGTYININNRDSLNIARYHLRNRAFQENRVSLLIHSEGVEETIDVTINRYRKNSNIDEIFVVLPERNTNKDKILAAGARIVLCPPDIELYGEMITHGIDQTPGDIVILAEASYSFPEHDINKLLEYMKDADMVIGTRTTRQLIEQGSDLTALVRLANVFLAKFMEFLWWRREVRLTDVGCTFRAIWKSSYADIRSRLHGKGPELLSEMIIETLNDRKRIIEIPVHYFNRSEALNKRYRNRKTFLNILLMISRKKIAYFFPHSSK
jgi:NDP-sugar pyrophosphorylase family protein